MKYDQTISIIYYNTPHTGLQAKEQNTLHPVMECRVFSESKPHGVHLICSYSAANAEKRSLSAG